MIYINNSPVYTSYTDKRKIKKHINRKLKYINKKELVMSSFFYKIMINDKLGGWGIYINSKNHAVFYTKCIQSTIRRTMFIGDSK